MSVTYTQNISITHFLVLGPRYIHRSHGAIYGKLLLGAKYVLPADGRLRTAKLCRT